ncbi:MAG: SDR family oxidoreductase [Chitinophagales bacterium]|nr:SDR family oxidoreductase [Chitinophagales bacterium]
MNEDLKNKVAIITGSSMGIGKAIAEELATRGVNLVLNGRDPEKLKITEAELRSRGAKVISVIADVRSPDECNKLVNDCIETFGRVDILVNNAGVTSRGSIEQMNPNVLHQVMDTNFLGSVFPTQAALPYLKKTKGHVIFINSIAGFVSIPYSSLYSCSKIAQSAMVDALRIELEGTGIHIGIAYCSFVQNDSRKKILEHNGKWVYLPQRKNVLRDKPLHVARRIVDMITSRSPKIIFTFIGKLTYFIERTFPWLIRLIFRFNRRKVRDEYTFIGGDMVYKATA